MMNILLVEPNYKNKYPPLGLMKISTYHKEKGDHVEFTKGISQQALSKIWDRVYITTLFTFHFSIVTKTIRAYKRCVRSTEDIYVGGILASLMPEELKRETGIDNVICGQLTSARILGFADDENIDIATPDYDILEEIEYKYPAGDNYFAYTTRGCPNKCPFCAVPKLEPVFTTTNNIKHQIEAINDRYGEKRNLLLLDNNILNSPELSHIIDDIRACGFDKQPNFVDPLKYDILLRRLQQDNSNEKYIFEIIRFLRQFKKRIKSQANLDIFLLCLRRIEGEATYESIQAEHDQLRPILEKYRNRVRKQRYVDFNQGIDARLLTESRMKIISRIPVRPLRIAFDNVTDEKVYRKAMHIAAKHGVRDFSNYILYNFNDKPVDLWSRLKINIDLKDELGVNIYSFPMKYIPITHTNREFYGKHWNKKYIRTIQAILLVKKGIVSSKRDFFEEAFGHDIEEFRELLMMPEELIIYRHHFRDNGITDQWRQQYHRLSEEDKCDLLKIIVQNKIVIVSSVSTSKDVKNILEYYRIKKPSE